MTFFDNKTYTYFMFDKEGNLLEIYTYDVSYSMMNKFLIHITNEYDFDKENLKFIIKEFNNDRTYTGDDIRIGRS